MLQMGNHMQDLCDHGMRGELGPDVFINFDSRIAPRALRSSQVVFTVGPAAESALTQFGRNI
jgi:hypothetical protein